MCVAALGGHEDCQHPVINPCCLAELEDGYFGAPLTAEARCVARFFCNGIRLEGKPPLKPVAEWTLPDFDVLREIAQVRQMV